MINVFLYEKKCTLLTRITNWVLNMWLGIYYNASYDPLKGKASFTKGSESKIKIINRNINNNKCHNLQYLLQLLHVGNSWNTPVNIYVLHNLDDIIFALVLVVIYSHLPWQWSLNAMSTQNRAAIRIGRRRSDHVTALRYHLGFNRVLCCTQSLPRLVRNWGADSCDLRRKIEPRSRQASRKN